MRALFRITCGRCKLNYIIFVELVVPKWSMRRKPDRRNHRPFHAQTPEIRPTTHQSIENSTAGKHHIETTELFKIQTTRKLIDYYRNLLS